jgi:hypothetical protein
VEAFLRFLLIQSESKALSAFAVSSILSRRPAAFAVSTDPHAGVVATEGLERRPLPAPASEVGIFSNSLFRHVFAILADTVESQNALAT